MEQALLVESNLLSRRRLACDLVAYGVTRSVIEARSVDHGMSVLQTVRLDGCFLGPRLHRERSIQFISNARQLSTNTNCVYIVLMGEEENAQPDSYIAAGAHGALKTPYSAQSLLEEVAEAVKRSSRGLRFKSSEPQRAAQEIKDLVLSESLQTLGREFAALAQQISDHRFSLRPDGTPSLALRDALRTIIEKSIWGSSEAAPAIGSAENKFVNSIVTWFCERTRLPHKCSLENLQRRLQS